MMLPIPVPSIDLPGMLMELKKTTEASVRGIPIFYTFNPLNQMKNAMESPVLSTTL
jgi:hypothetical protein